MTELSFLVDLLLNHPLKKATKDIIAERIKLISIAQITIPATASVSPISSRAISAVPQPSSMTITPIDPPVPPSQIAQTPEAAQALAARAAMINAKLANPLKTDGGIFKPLPKPKA